MHLNEFNQSPMVGVKSLKPFSVANNAATKNLRTFIILHMYWLLSMKFLVQRVFVLLNYRQNVLHMIIQFLLPMEMDAHKGGAAAVAPSLAFWSHSRVSEPNGLLDQCPPQQEPSKVLYLHSYLLTGEDSHRGSAGSACSLRFWKSLPKFRATTSC